MAIPFLEWLYAQDLDDLNSLPNYVEVEGFFDRADRKRKEQERADQMKEAP